MANTDRPLTIQGPVMRTIIAGYVILAIGVVLGLYGAYHASQRASHISNCVTVWANATSTRSALLTRLSTARTDALDEVIRDVAARAPTKFRRDLRAYIAASDAYADAVKTHPLPMPPRIRC